MASKTVLMTTTALAVVAAASLAVSKLLKKKRQLKLTYFDIGGPAEAIRLTFAIGGVEFVDERLKRDVFLKMKPDLPFGQVPILEIDGTILPQSAAILRLAGRLAGLYPKCLIEAAKCDAVVDSLTDLQGAIRPSLREEDPEKKMALRAELAKTTLPDWLGKLEKILVASGGLWFAGGRITTCDIAVATRLKWLRSGILDGIPTTVADPFPAICSLQERVYEHPAVVSWYAAKEGK